MTQQPRSFRIIPTLDLVTPTALKQPGVLIACENHEPAADGAHRIDGYERVDGQTKASAATYYVLNFDAGTATIAEGATVTGATSGATGKTLIAMVVESGTFGGSNAAGYLVLTSLSGTFQDNENLQVAAVTKCVANGVAALEGALNDTNHNTWSQDAQETQRALIGAVPGQGNLRGGWVLAGVRYVVRDWTGGTEARLYKSTTAGWVQVALGRRLAYTSGGTYVIQVGDVITGATSGAQATVTRITLTSSQDETTGNAAGWIFFASQTGVFVAENLNVGANLNVATIAGDSSAITLPAGGRYETVIHNFYGLSTSRRIYGVNGVGPAFEFDGTTFVLLQSSQTTDTPNHIAIDEQHLILSFRGGRIINSGDGMPDNYTAAFGAGDYGLGDECTGMVGPYNQALFVCTRNYTKMLLGHDINDFQLLNNSTVGGAIEWTIQMVNKPTYMDDAGLRDATGGATFGNFNISTLTRLIEPWLTGKKALGVTPVASLVCKRKSQYRLFFSDGSVLHVYYGAQTINPATGATSLPQILISNLPEAPSFVSSMEDGLGNEVMLMGNSTGYLYELDSGYNFDGTEIEAYFRTAYDAAKSPDYIKRYHAGTIEGTFPSTASLAYHAEYDGGDALQSPTAERVLEIAGNGGIWSDFYNWNEFLWSASTIGKGRLELRGRGENMSLAVISNMTYERPYTVSAMSYHYSLRRLNRMKVAS